jgi:hypothetical protein
MGAVWICKELFIGQILRRSLYRFMVSYLVPARSLVGIREMVRIDGRTILIIDHLLAIHVLLLYKLFGTCAVMAAIN